MSVQESKLVEVDLGIGEIKTQNFAALAPGNALGNFGLSYQVWEEVWIDALHSNNLISIDTGLLTGSGAPGSGAYSISFIKPFTRQIVTWQGEGLLGPELRYAGIEHLLIRGRAKTPVYLVIDNDGIRIEAAEQIWNLDTMASTDWIRQQCDDDYTVICIGPDPIVKSSHSCLISDYYFQVGGAQSGNVFHSCNLKAIAVRGSGKVQLASPEKYLALCTEIYQKTPAKSNSCPKFGNMRRSLYMSPWNEVMMSKVPDEPSRLVVSTLDSITGGERAQMLRTRSQANLDGTAWNDTDDYLDVLSLDAAAVAIKALGLNWDNGFTMADRIDWAARLLTYLTGTSWSRHQLEEKGRQIIDLRKHLKGGVDHEKRQESSQI